MALWVPSRNYEIPHTTTFFPEIQLDEVFDFFHSFSKKSNYQATYYASGIILSVGYTMIGGKNQKQRKNERCLQLSSLGSMD